MGIDSISPDAWTVGDMVTLSPTFKDRITEAVKDLTGATVQVIWWPEGASSTTAGMTLSGTPTDGNATYKFPAPGLASTLADTELYWQYKVTDSSSNVFYSDEVFRKHVRAAP